MKAFNVEIWSRDFTLKDHHVVNDVSYDFDYLSYGKNKITIDLVNASYGDFIIIENDEESYHGIISATENTNDNQMKITYVDYISLLDVDIFPDLDKFNELEVELYLMHELKMMYEINTDYLQNITGFTASNVSETINSAILLDEFTIYNFYDDIVLPIMQAYGIVIDFSLDVQNKQMVVTVGKNEAQTIVMESELPDCKIINFQLKQSSKTVNKVVIYNEDFTENLEFYRTETGDVTSTSENRIYPVEFEIYSVNEDDELTFEEVALAKAVSVFSKVEYENLIQLEYEKNNDLVKPLELKIGQVVEIIYNEISYKSYLTGFKIDEKIQLIFGNIRLELTKILKGRG